MNDFAAFPIPLDDRPGAYPAEPGMSFRDAAALTALPAVIQLCYTDSLQGHPTPEAMFAAKAYRIADEMLKARLTAGVQPTAAVRDDDPQVGEPARSAAWKEWKATREFYNWHTTEQHAGLNFAAGFKAGVKAARGVSETSDEAQQARNADVGMGSAEGRKA